MKRIIPLCLALIMTVGLLAGCGKQNEPAASDETRLRVVTTIFPEYDWVREILGDTAASDETRLRVVTRFSPNTIGSEKFSVTRRITPK